MHQTPAKPVLFQRLWKVSRYFFLLLLALVVLYGIARFVHVELGSFYQGGRGPYLQMPDDTAMTIRWQSPQSQIGRIRYGRSPQALDQMISETVATETHEVRLTGLLPLTRYFYRRVEKPDEINHFVTAPTVGSHDAIRFWVTGDQGYFGPVQTAVTKAAWQWLDTHSREHRDRIDFWLTTGDNAYRAGTNDEFQKNFFQPFADILKLYPVWPTYGNHDARRSPFFDIFSLPTNAESGGTASHTEHYYSFDYGQLHVVMLDTEDSPLTVDGAMLQWLQADLKATQQPWRIVVMHHPPYTKGGHNSDSEGDSHGRLFAVRENLAPLLDRLGVDLVMSGHSHDYERSHALACYYGTSDKWQNKYVRDNSSPYRKGSGAIYMVIGSSSKLDNGPLNHPAMAVSLKQSGSVIIDIDNNALTSRFINQQGEIADQFQIVKDNKSQTMGTKHCE